MIWQAIQQAAAAAPGEVQREEEERQRQEQERLQAQQELERQERERQERERQREEREREREEREWERQRREREREEERHWRRYSDCARAAGEYASREEPHLRLRERWELIGREAMEVAGAAVRAGVPAQLARQAAIQAAREQMWLGDAVEGQGVSAACAARIRESIAASLARDSSLSAEVFELAMAGIAGDPAEEAPEVDEAGEAGEAGADEHAVLHVESAGQRRREAEHAAEQGADDQEAEAAQVHLQKHDRRRRRHSGKAQGPGQRPVAGGVHAEEPVRQDAQQQQGEQAGPEGQAPEPRRGGRRRKRQQKVDGGDAADAAGVGALAGPAEDVAPAAEHLPMSSCGCPHRSAGRGRPSQSAAYSASP